jgi:hypothetical protein
MGHSEWVGVAQRVWYGLVAAAGIAVVLLWALPTTFWCWVGASNVTRGASPQWGAAAFLVGWGLVPWLFAAAVMHRWRRNRHSAVVSLAVGVMVLTVVTFPVLLLRALMAGGF